VLLPRVSSSSGTAIDRSVGLYDGTGRLAGMIGGPLAGVLVAASSAAGVIAIDAGTFFLSAMIIALKARPSAPSIAIPAIARKSPYMMNLREGLDYLLRDRLLLAIAGMVIVTNLLDQAYFSVLLPVWVRKELGSPVALGTISAAFGIGAVTGNAVMAWLAPRLPRRIPFAFSFLLCGAPRFIALALAPGLSPVIAVAFISGIGAGGINPALGAVEYERVPARLQARVLGAINALAWAGLPFGGLLGGVLSDSLGPRAALVACGAVYLAATLSPFVFPVWRQMERASPGVVAAAPENSTAVSPALAQEPNSIP
jgi:predicted MFS family arabinose efflux permease